MMKVRKPSKVVPGELYLIPRPNVSRRSIDTSLPLASIVPKCFVARVLAVLPERRSNKFLCFVLGYGRYRIVQSSRAFVRRVNMDEVSEWIRYEAEQRHRMDRELAARSAMSTGRTPGWQSG